MLPRDIKSPANLLFRALSRAAVGASGSLWRREQNKRQPYRGVYTNAIHATRPPRPPGKEHNIRTCARAFVCARATLNNRIAARVNKGLGLGSSSSTRTLRARCYGWRLNKFFFFFLTFGVRVKFCRGTPASH